MDDQEAGGERERERVQNKTGDTQDQQGKYEAKIQGR